MRQYYADIFFWCCTKSCYPYSHLVTCCSLICSFFAVCCPTPSVWFFFLVPCALIGYLTDSLLSAIFHLLLFTGCFFPSSRYLLFVTRYMLLASRWPQIAVCFVSNCSCFLLSTCSSSRQSLSLPSDFRCSTFAASAIALRCSLFAVESSLLPSLLWIKGA